MYTPDGYKRLEEAGVTDILAQPWLMRGVAPDGPVEEKIDAIKWFTDSHIAPLR